MGNTFRRNTIVPELVLDGKLALHRRLDRLLARMQPGKRARRLADVELFGLFIGYPRSGHSVVGSLIDAHAEAVTAHRLSALDYLRRGVPMDIVLDMAIRNALRFSRSGRTLTGYSYPIADLWQGRWKRLRVICDQEGTNNATLLYEHPQLLDTLYQRHAPRIRFIHVIRNPFDNITTMAIRTLRSLEATAERYFGLCDAVRSICDRIESIDVIHLHHERLIADPDTELGRLLERLDLSNDPAYLDGCRRVLHNKPSRTRDQRRWPAALVESVGARMSTYPWLEGYAFEDEL